MKSSNITHPLTRGVPWKCIFAMMSENKSSDPELKYITAGTQQNLFPTTAFFHCIPAPQSLLSVSGRFRKDLSHHRNSRSNKIPHPWTLPSPPIHEKILRTPHISFQHSSKNPRTPTNKIPTFLKCGQHKQFRTIFVLRLPDLSVNCSDFCNHVIHFL